MKKYLISLSFLAIAVCAMAQSGTNSPYSMFGLGKIADRSVGASRGMNGVGLAFREHNTVNSLNPASYSAVDSLSFIFDLGMSLQNTNYKEYDATKSANVSRNVKNADFEYAIGLFRLVKHVGMSFGILPYTTVGYSFSQTPKNAIDKYVIAPSTETTTKQTMTYSCSGGGIHEIFLGAGWATPIEGLSVGANIGYIWGDINRYATLSYTDASAKSLARQYLTTIRNYKLDIGVQYERQIDEKYTASAGLTFSPGHRLGCDPECKVITTNSSSSVCDTTSSVAGNALEIPTEIGIGFALRHTNTWRVGLDYTFQSWKSCDYPIYTEVNGNSAYVVSNDYYLNRHSIKAGGEYCKNEYGRDFVDRLRYRFGVGYTSPFLNLNGKNGPREISISAGIGVPIMNAYNNRSILNIGFSWQNYSAKDFITENTLMLNIGITFNERWFAKWKFE